MNYYIIATSDLEYYIADPTVMSAKIGFRPETNISHGAKQFSDREAAESFLKSIVPDEYIPESYLVRFKIFKVSYTIEE